MTARALLAAALALVGASPLLACESAQRAPEIYPTAVVLPENVLRFYVYFPERMQPGEIWQHIAIHDSRGERLRDVFLEGNFDLWSPDGRRLTLLVNPGRVKTGLEAHAELGRAFTQGERYTLSVDGAALTVVGCPLGARVEYAFSIGPADLNAPAPGEWSLDAPRVGTRDQISVDLGSAHDHLSIAYRIRVFDAVGALVPGRVALGDGESSWHFTPEAPWLDQSYSLAIDGRLEDLAGNRPGGLFDRPVEAGEINWPRSITWQPHLN